MRNALYVELYVLFSNGVHLIVLDAEMDELRKKKVVIMNAVCDARTKY